MSQSQSQSQSSGLVPETPPVPSVHGYPLVASYTFRSEIPKKAREVGVQCVLGVDEAGRGPVMGPLVYGIAYCPTSFSDELKGVGFADSKALTAERRDALLAALIDNPDQLGWATRTMSPQEISAGMLRRRPHNLNAQSTEATVELISGVLESGVDVAEIYVDTVGDPATYCKTLKSYFPQSKYKHIEWTVTSKADAIYPIVGAASIAAKVTRDRWVEDWRYAEAVGDDAPDAVAADVVGESQSQSQSQDGVLQDASNQSFPQSSSSRPSSPTKKSNGKRKRGDNSAGTVALTATGHPRRFWHEFGSGYPSDPNTVSYLQRTLDPVFGFPGVVRFSWATVKTMLEEKTKAKSGGAVSSGQGRTTRTQAAAVVQEPSKELQTSTDSGSESMVNLSPSGSRLPPAGQPRGYKVRWVDEPAQITSFFASKGGANGIKGIGGVGIVDEKALMASLAKHDEDKLRRERRGVFKDLGLCAVGPAGLGL